MSAVRHNLITGEPVLYAPERAGRPNAFAHDAIDVCPFCRGHESITPAEVARVERDGRWIARAFPNKYPASPHHEIIVESDEHEARFESLPHAAAVTQLYVDRYRAMRSHKSVAYASLFKNNGAMAGASIDHIHSQLLGVPELPPRIARESEGFMRAASCPLCSDATSIVIRDATHFVWSVPYASTMAHQQWIVPKRHVSEPHDLDPSEITELAALLQTAAAGMSRIASSYNWSFVSFPTTRAGHFYVELFPRLTSVAGFELGTDLFIQVVDPAITARKMKTP
ncbi:MAG: galactose-1-phosphate uridylyltransferase [Thermoanaerobaculia bacterium]